MTTLTSPQPRRRLRLPLIPLITSIALIAGIATVLLLRSSLFQRTDPLQGRSTATVSRGPLVARVNATGTLDPRTTSALAFPSAGGRVTQVLVAEGDRVAKDQPLLTLELRRLQASVAAAEADVAQARAELQSVNDGATPAQIDAAKAQVDAARGALTQTVGSVTAEDVRAAQARVAEARALVARLEAGAKPVDLAAADAQLQQAQVNVQQQRDNLSAAKNNAELALSQAASALVQAQATFDAAKRNWDYATSTGKDPQNPTRTDAKGNTVANKLNDAQRQQYYSTFIQAEAGLRSAEAAMQQAQLARDNAHQAEISGIATAEQQARAAQANSDKVRAGSDRDQIEAARAQLASAQADLTKLQGQQRSGALQAQRANLANAEAQLAQIEADPTSSTIARNQAAVARAQAQLELARADLDSATLRAPFAGVIGAVNIAPGEAIGTQAPITLLDIDHYIVTLQVNEVDVARVAIGQSVDVTIDALDGQTLRGTVRRITPQAKAENKVTAYAVTVEVDPAQRPVKPGMTASAAIITARAENALAVPARAVRQENGRSVIDVVTKDQSGATQITAQPVTTGLRAGDQIEIRSGLTAGQQIVLP